MSQRRRVSRTFISYKLFSGGKRNEDEKWHLSFYNAGLT